MARIATPDTTAIHLAKRSPRGNSGGLVRSIAGSVRRPLPDTTAKLINPKVLLSAKFPTAHRL